MPGRQSSLAVVSGRVWVKHYATQLRVPFDPTGGRNAAGGERVWHAATARGRNAAEETREGRGRAFKRGQKMFRENNYIKAWMLNPNDRSLSRQHMESPEK